MNRLSRWWSIKFKSQDCYVGAYWQQCAYRFDIWLVLIPMLPLHIGWLRRGWTWDKVKIYETERRGWIDLLRVTLGNLPSLGLNK